MKHIYLVRFTETARIIGAFARKSTAEDQAARNRKHYGQDAVEVFDLIVIDA